MNKDFQATVLIVDDNKINTEIIVAMLKDKYNLRVARNGEECLKRCAIEPYPDIILLDIMMPVMDGYETIIELKKKLLTRDIPVIFLTALSDTDDIVKGFELGAVDYLTKPFNMTELFARIKTHIELKQVRTQIQSQNEVLENLNTALQGKIDQQMAYIEKARILQDSLIQRELPLPDEFSINALYMPCEDLGGDFFSIIRGFCREKLILIIGDCTGHGVNSSLEASFLTSVIQSRMFSLFENGDTGAFLAEINRRVISIADEDQFPTMLVCILDLNSKVLTYSSANGVLPVLVRGGSIGSIPRASGMHLGYDISTEYETCRLNLEKNDRLLFFSDAVFEFNAENDGIAGIGKFTRLLKNIPGGPEPDFEELIKKLEEAAGRLPLEDDTTIIQIDFTGNFRKNFSFSELESLKSVLMEIDEMLILSGYSQDEVRKMCIGLDEMCLNAYYHGNREDSEKSVTIDAEINCEEVKFTVSDMGEGFILSDLQDPVENIMEIYASDNPEEYTHGRGIAVTRMFYDSVQYNEPGTSVALSRKKDVKTVKFI